MKTRLAQLNPTIGDIRGNTDKVLASVDAAIKDNIDLLLLPELIVCGYPPMDLLEREDFREAIYKANEKIIVATKGTELSLLFGTVTSNESGDGRPIFNTALYVEGGKVIDRIHKTLLPTYDIFDDLRYFEPNKEFHLTEIKGVKFGVTVCEDIWFNDNEIQYHNYTVNPMEKLCGLGAEVIINLSASPYSKNKTESRSHMLRSHARAFATPVLYVNQVGANTEIIFDGDSLACDTEGNLIARAEIFNEENIDLEIKGDQVSTLSENGIAEQKPKTAQMFEALKYGLSEYLSKTKLTADVCLGLSGGIDSALVAVVAAEALGPEHVHALTMPSEFSSEGSISDSQKLAENLGIHLHEVPIKDINNDFGEALSGLFEGTGFGVAEENIQSRIRGTLLMALANKFGYMLLNTGNKSEYAVGYCTLYGDMAGGLSILSDVYKTEVYDICRWLNESYFGKEVIPQSIIDKAPSAELRPDQKDTDTLPEYEILDQILIGYIEKQESAEQIISSGIDESIVREIIRKVDYNEHKRFQAAPGLRISIKAFGSGRRWPIVQGWTRQH